ncbi:MAG: MGH1-like glycoside hydrolase domain-containing protein [Gammaproteobacteria bacterium]
MNDLASMASSKALSTNVAHYQALLLAAQLAGEHGDKGKQVRYGGWAAQLKRAINERLWLDDAGMYSSLTGAHFDGAPMYKFDWLGQALAIVTGVADEARARSILAHYPHGPMGAPVIYPQQQDQPVYHNRAMWPFVTAYGLKAATRSGNVAVADAAYATLMRGAALNLSNRENLEWLSGQPLLLDEAHPELIGPVINSRRQLWSVGAYLGMVIEQVFGVRATSDGLRIAPFITARLRRDAFGQSDAIELKDLTLHGRRVSVRIALPPVAQGEGYYPVESIRVNGAPVGPSPAIKLTGDAHIEVRLGPLQAGEQAITRVTADPYREDAAVFGPREPAITALERSGAAVRVVIGAARGEANTLYNVYRDGKVVARGLPAGVWIDRAPGPFSCYALEARFTDSGNRSHHSPARCLDSGMTIGVDEARVVSNVKASLAQGRFAAAPRLQDWGAPQDRFAAERVRVAQPGLYQLQLRYHNAANQINLGISGGVKWMAVKDAAGRTVAGGVVQLPHARLDKTDTPLVYSTPLAARLGTGSYRIELSDFYNMSYLDSNRTFSAAGGVDGPANRMDMYAVRLLRTE